MQSLRMDNDYMSMDQEEEVGDPFTACLSFDVSMKQIFITVLCIIVNSFVCYFLTTK